MFVCLFACLFVCFVFFFAKTITDLGEVVKNYIEGKGTSLIINSSCMQLWFHRPPHDTRIEGPQRQALLGVQKPGLMLTSDGSQKKHHSHVNIADRQYLYQKHT